MRTDPQRNLGYQVLQCVEGAIIAGLLLSPFVLAFDPAKMPSWLAISQVKMQQIQWWIKFADALGSAMLVPIRRWQTKIGSPNTWLQVQAILDQLQDDLFHGAGPRDHHQITIFRHRKFAVFAAPWCRSWCCWWGHGHWCGSGWLVAAARSGHAKKHTKAIFCAPDNPDEAEGVAGMAWQVGGCGNTPEPIEDLPSVDSHATTAKRRLYADRTNVKPECVDWYIKKGRPLPMSFFGRPIEVSGKVWGAMVIDSRLPKLPDRARIETATNTAARLLAAALKGL